MKSNTCRSEPSIKGTTLFCFGAPDDITRPDCRNTLSDIWNTKGPLSNEVPKGWRRNQEEEFGRGFVETWLWWFMGRFGHLNLYDLVWGCSRAFFYGRTELLETLLSVLLLVQNRHSLQEFGIVSSLVRGNNSSWTLRKFQLEHGTCWSMPRNCAFARHFLAFGEHLEVFIAVLAWLEPERLEFLDTQPFGIQRSPNLKVSQQSCCQSNFLMFQETSMDAREVGDTVVV